MIRGYSRYLRALDIWMTSEQGTGVPNLVLGSVVEGAASLYEFGLLFAHCLVQYESYLLQVCMLCEAQINCN